MKVEIWSDVVCPWCYVGKRRFEKALESFPHPVELTWKSFQLDPSASSQPAGEQAARLAEKYGKSVAEAEQMLASMTQTAAAEGLHFHFEKARSGNTFDAHRVLHLALEQGLQDPLKERLDLAYFTEGEAIDDHETLARLAAEVGVTGAAGVLESDTYAAEVRHDIAEGRELGISGVPFFVLDRRFGISGAQSPEVILQALEQAWSTQTPSLVTTTGGDACEGDTCAV